MLTIFVHFFLRKDRQLQLYNPSIEGSDREGRTIIDSRPQFTEPSVNITESDVFR